MRDWQIDAALTASTLALMLGLAMFATPVLAPVGALLAASGGGGMVVAFLADNRGPGGFA